MKIIMKRVVGSIWFFVMLLIAIVFAVTDVLNTTERIIIPIVFAALGVTGLMLLLRRRDQKIKNRKSNYKQTQKDLVSLGELAVIPSTLIIPKPNELIHFILPAKRLITENKAVGSIGGGAGVGIRVSKRVSVHAGRGKSRTIYNDVTTVFKGTLYLTNQRIIFINDRQGFEIDLNKLASMDISGRQLFFQTENNPFVLTTKATRLCRDTVRLILNKKNETA